MPTISAFVSWPDAPLTSSLVKNALNKITTPTKIYSTLQEKIADHFTLQWASYDCIDHELGLAQRNTTLTSSYTFRKGLIRKHFLSRLIHTYVTKCPTSILKNAFPRTFEMELSFADELGEMWMDDLWELGLALDEGDHWWILKPGMADRGNGIRLFNSKEGLAQILEEFEGNDDEDGSGAEDEVKESLIVTSQLRHFVIQTYISDPWLMNPSDVPVDGQAVKHGKFKFHLRTYVVAVGAISVYLYDRVLALFSGTPYSSPTTNTIGDLSAHLTNTCLQTEGNEGCVRLLSELATHPVLSDEGRILTEQDTADILIQISQVLSDAFMAALQSPAYFQPMPNAFELYGVDFLIEHPETFDATLATKNYRVKLLEFNSEPAIEMTGSRLEWILEDLFVGIGRVAVDPFFSQADNEGWDVGTTRDNFVKCLDIKLGQYL